MAGISVGGLGSGLDINSLVQQLVAAEGSPVVSRYDRREVEIQTELSGLGFLKSAISDFQSSLNGLKGLTDFTTVSAKSSATSVFTVAAGSDASAGSFNLEVQQVAAKHKLASDTFASKDTVVGTGSITFDYGTFSGGSFTLNSSRTSDTVDLTGTDGTLTSIRDAINDADVGVTASIINDGSGYRLIFTSSQSGEANSLRISTDDDDLNDTNASGLSQLAYDPEAGVGSGKNLTETIAAADAQMVLDGLAVTSESNTVTDLIEGVTINLVSADPGVDHSLTVTETTSAGLAEVGKFVEAYNALNDTLRQLSMINVQTGERGILFGDSTLRSVQSQLAFSISGSITSLNSDYNSLASIGIKSGEKGVLSIDTSIFNTATQEEPDIVARLFSEYGKTSDSNVAFITAGSDTSVGNYAINVTQAATQGDVIGDTAANLTISAGSNDTVQLTVDGTVLTVTLTAKTYADADELALELQNKINSHANLDDTDKSVSVVQSGGVLQVISNSYGSDSTVTVDGGNGSNDLFGVTTSTDGVDIQGTIGGQVATGVGQFLTTTDGLKIQVLSGTTGDRGTINFTRGLAETLDDYLDGMTSSDGVIGLRQNILNGKIDSLNDDRLALSQRLGRLETRLLDQFTNLDLLLTGFQQTSSFLVGALSSLPGSTPISSSSR